MAYRLYQTEGVILGSRPTGEASRVLEILTPELGLVSAVAQSSRKLGSKLRYHLTDHSLIRVGLIRGREFWWLVSAESLPPASPTSFTLPSLRSLTRVLVLARRLIHGEGEQAKVFADLKAGRVFVGGQVLTEEELSNYVLIAGARVLRALGYFAPAGVLATAVQFSVWESSVLKLAHAVRAELVTEINRALASSQL